MPDIQKYFEDFHSKIRLNDENEILREKRDIILNKLRSRLKEIFEERGETPPAFIHFNKGSYAMHTGVVPLDCDFDIDVGLIFNILKDDYPDPVVVKEWVYDALYGHTDNVTMMQPCVRVQYHLNNEPIYHVDLAIYSHLGNIQGDIYLARGKLYSSSERRVWQLDDPKGFMEVIRNKYQNEDDRKQFRRIIRYLKRWKDIKFPSDGNAAPIGIGVTVAAYKWFNSTRILIDPFQNKFKYNDLDTLQSFVNQMLWQFRLVYHDDEQIERLIVNLPVQPYNDSFAKMTNLQMTNFKERLEQLRDVIEETKNEADPVRACEILQSQFGDDFPVPERNETAQRKAAPAIISSSSSA